MYKKFLVIGLVASTSLFTPQQAGAETLSQSVSRALAEHPSVEAALANKDVAHAEKKEAQSGYYPFVSAGTSVGAIYANNSTSRGLTVTRGSANSGLFEANASVTQPLFDGLQTNNRVDASNARMQSADYNVLDVKESLALRAVQAHIAVLQAQATVARTQSYFDTIEDYLGRIELMVDEGVADESETSQARNISLMLKSTLTDYEGQLNAAIAGYKEIVGTMPQSALVKPNAVHSLGGDIQSAMVFAKNNHPLIKAKEKEMEAIGYDIKVEKGAIFPTLDAEVSGIKREQKEEIGGELDDARALLKLSWEFETGGATNARINKSKAEYAEIIAENNEQLRTIEGDIRRAYAELDTAKRQVELVKKREVVTKDLFEAYKTQFEGARVRLLQLMQAENQLFNSQLESITAEYRYLFAQYNVLASLGQLQKTVLGGAAPLVSAGTSSQVTPASYTPRKVQRNIKPQVNFDSKTTMPAVAQKNVEPAPAISENKMISPRAPKPSTIVPTAPVNPIQRQNTRLPTSSLSGSSERVYINTK